MDFKTFRTVKDKGIQKKKTHTGSQNQKKRNVDIVNQDKRITITHITYHVKLEVFTASEGCVSYTERWCKSIYQIFIIKYQFFFIFLLQDNCFTEFCCFLSNLNMNQPQVYIYPLPSDPPSHLPPHPTPLGWYRAPVWISWARQQIPRWLSILHMVT